MESRFRADLIAWLRADATLVAALNAVEEESPVAASPPWLGIAASASADWSTKTHTGREVRIALELVERQDDPEAVAATVAAIERRVATLAPVQSGSRVVVTQFLRSRADRRPRSLSALLLEYSFRLLANPEE